MCSFPITVTNAAQFYDAVGCFNAETAVGPHEIVIAASFMLDAGQAVPDNPDKTIELNISGGGHTIGANANGRHIGSLSPLTITDLTLTNGTGDFGLSSGFRG